jgi:hypothetical protein
MTIRMVIARKLLSARLEAEGEAERAMNIKSRAA